ncbi:MAG: hypothetical protein ACRD21_07035 [Vicinamibacteria bacterium]
MKRKRLLAIAVGMALLAPALALSDPFIPCEAPPILAPTPLSAGAILDLVLGPMVEDGISILLLGALAVVGVPWILAGLAVALVHRAERFKPRR